MRFKVVLAISLLFAGALVARAAQDVVVRNRGLAQGNITVSTANSVADLGSSVYMPPVAFNGAANVRVSASSGTASATCKVLVALGTVDDTGAFICIEGNVSGTLTADGTFKTSDGKYCAGGVTVAASGYTHFRVIVHTLSTGTLTVTWSTF